MLAPDLTSIFETCEKVWVPKWFDEFSNPNGGFYERLDVDNAPINLPRRLLTQCRQIMVYSKYHDRYPNPEIANKIRDTFRFMISSYQSSHLGGFHFSLNEESRVHDSKYDLYGHAFVILACAAYYNAFHNTEALEVAKNTLTFIKSHFQLKTAPGLTEALDENLQPIPSIRRQNPHMHLMEACIYMYEASKDVAYIDTADEMFSLFYSHLYVDKTIREFFDEQLNPHEEKGHIVEAGHHAEWVWLLARYQEIKGHQIDQATATMTQLFSWVAKYGFDKEQDGIYNSQNLQGHAIDSEKRIWPVFETLRAAAALSSSAHSTNCQNDVISHTTDLIRRYVQENGIWTEMMTRGLTPQSDFRPGTTPYHIYLPLLETCTKYQPK